MKYQTLLEALQELDTALKNMKKEFCRNLTDESVGEGEPQTAELTRIYAGTEDFVEFFEKVICALGVEDILEYEVEDVDGEYEIVIKGAI